MFFSQALQTCNIWTTKDSALTEHLYCCHQTSFGDYWDERPGDKYEETTSTENKVFGDVCFLQAMNGGSTDQIGIGCRAKIRFGLRIY